MQGNCAKTAVLLGESMGMHVCLGECEFWGTSFRADVPVKATGASGWISYLNAA